MKEILLEWICESITSSILLTQESFDLYIGNTNSPFIKLQEYKLRKQLIEKYLEKPEESTIVSFFEELMYNYNEYGYAEVEKLVFYKTINRFKLDQQRFKLNKI